MNGADILCCALAGTNVVCLLMSSYLTKAHRHHVAELNKINADYVKALKASYEAQIEMWRSFQLKKYPDAEEFYNSLVNSSDPTKEKH